MNRFFYFILIILALTACQKEASNIFEPYPNDPLNDTLWVEKVSETSAANRIKVEFSNAAIIDSFDATATSVLHLSDNLEITIPANSCTFSNGVSVSSKVVLSVNHLNTKGEYISFSRATCSYVTPMETVGSFYLKGTSQGQEVFIKPSKRIIISFRDSIPVNNMKVYYGVENPMPPYPLGTNEQFTWLPSSDTSSVSTFTKFNSTGTIKGYSMFANSFKWISCSRTMNSGVNNTQINVLMPSNYTNKNTTVYAFLKDKKTVIQLYGDYKSRTFFSPSIPLNSTITLVAISLRGTEFYLSKKDISVTPQMIISISTEQKNKAEISKYLRSF